MDILTSLPHCDVLFPGVFAFLSIEDLFMLRLVSKTFCDLISEYFAICTDFDFSKMKKKGNSVVFKLMTEHNTSLQRLCLAGATHWLTDRLLLPVIPNCEMLSYIDLTSCSQLTTKVPIALAKYCHRLTCLKLSSCHWVDEHSFQLLIESNKKLTHVDVSSCWSLTDKSICFCATSCSDLRSLKLTNIYSITDMSLSTVASCCPQLHTLAINGCWRVTNHGVRAIGEYCSQLVRLFVSDCRDVNEASLARLRSRGIDIDVAPTPSGTLDRPGSTLRYATPFINLQI